MTPEERVAAVASQYDDSGALVAEALRALERRQRDSGKVCIVCFDKKPLSAFGRDDRTPTGLKYTCNSCLAARRQATRRVVLSRPPTPM